MIGVPAPWPRPQSDAELTTSAKSDNSSLQSYIFTGYDSNPIGLSDNEINQLDMYPSLLGNAEEVFSPFVGFNIKLKLTDYCYNYIHVF